MLFSATCQVAFHVLSTVHPFQCGCQSFCSHRVVFPSHQMRPHVDPPSILGIDRHVICATFDLSCSPQLVLCVCSLSLSQPLTPCMHTFSPCPSWFSQQLLEFVLDILCCVAFLLFHATPPLHNQNNLQCDREPRCHQTTRKTFSAQLLKFFPQQSTVMDSCSLFFRCDFLRLFQCGPHHFLHFMHPSVVVSSTFRIVHLMSW